MGQLYYPAAFFSYPAIMYFTAGVAGVFTALHHMWKANARPAGEQRPQTPKLHLLLETGRGKLRAMNRSLRNGGAALEAFKFACYLAVPIGMTVFVAYNPTMLNKVIQNRKYVVYPPEGPRPPSNEELWEKLGKRSQDNGSAAK